MQKINMHYKKNQLMEWNVAMMENRKFNFEYLVLLVGKNPLPNYVVARYFINYNTNLKKIFLVFSLQTAKEKIQLRKLLKKYWNNKNMENINANNMEEKFEECEIKYVADPSNIIENVKECILNNIKIINGVWNEIHLNYTGGTKTMSIHAREAVIKAVNKEKGYTDFKFTNKKASFSYLDSRDFKIIFDGVGKGIVKYNNTEDLRKEECLQLTPDEIFELHGQKLEGEESYCWEKPLEYIYKNFIEKEKLSDLLDHKDALKEIAKEYSRKKILNKILLSKIRNKDTKQKLEGLIDCVSQNGFLKGAEKFFNGCWLDGYIEWVFRCYDKKEEKRKPIYSELRSNLKKIKENPDFEIDTIITKGYQVCGISCKTASDNTTIECRKCSSSIKIEGDFNTSKAKLFGFEVYHRTKQLGGDEAKPVLITCLDTQQVNNVFASLQGITGESGSENKDRILVLGIKDLEPETMREKIYDFMNNKK
ncbi:MAG: hypothetical protein K8T10_19930 [Candidatus Eremiobacteraeota bacterium]|nr:hypothetical protein [Candidatus Eremiobacteraeota bacterium]